jgi:hypothetical protein
MIRRVLLSGAALLWLGGASVMADDCTGCQKMAQTGMGFCDECGHGKAFGVDLESKKLYEALSGTEVKKLEDLKCKGCQDAVRTNGTCTRCKLGAARRQLYKSPVAHAIAIGRYAPADKTPKCAKTSEPHKDGWCDSCGIGMVGGQFFKNKDMFNAASKAHEILVRAVKTAEQCEDCAVAMVLDGKCDKCKVAYKNGEKQSG